MTYIPGTRGNDARNGTSSNDEIDGFGGNDALKGARWRSRRGDMGPQQRAI